MLCILKKLRFPERMTKHIDFHLSGIRKEFVEQFKIVPGVLQTESFADMSQLCKTSSSVISLLSNLNALAHFMKPTHDSSDHSKASQIGRLLAEIDELSFQVTRCVSIYYQFVSKNVGVSSETEGLNAFHFETLRAILLNVCARFIRIVTVDHESLIDEFLGNKLSNRIMEICLTPPPSFNQKVEIKEGFSQSAVDLCSSNPLYC